MDIPEAIEKLERQIAEECVGEVSAVLDRYRVKHNDAALTSLRDWIASQIEIRMN